MPTEIWIKFRGICTHLTATHEMANAPKFAPRTGDGQSVQHRVFLANSDLIRGNIDDKRNVVPHVPRLRIPNAPDGEWSDHVLLEDSIAFEGLDPSHGNKKHGDQLSPLPSMWLKGDRPVLQQGVLESWTPYAAAYIDFVGEGGIRFSAGIQEILVQVCFAGEAALVHRRMNVGTGTRYPLPDNTVIEITNLPADPTKCGDSDYLLHYFATTVDLRNHAPVWTPQVTAEKKIQVMQESRMGEVYCSNSTYP